MMRVLLSLVAVVVAFFIGVGFASWQVSEAFKTPEGVQICRDLLGGGQ